MGILIVEMFLIIGVVIYVVNRVVDSLADDLTPYNFSKKENNVTFKK